MGRGLNQKGLLYSILRQVVATVFRIYFRKIYLNGRTHVPADKPVLLACNHPMAFTEACLLACFLDRPLHFLVRGDVFNSKWTWFLHQTNQIPIYRFRDGFRNMRRNAQSFSWAYKALAEGKAIVIFSEGNTCLQKRLAPLQKGTAKLAFGTLEAHDVADLQIVPVGVNYSQGTRFRSDVMIEIGSPIKVEDYWKTYQEDAIEGTRQLTEDLYHHMLPLIIHIELDENLLKADEIFQRLDQLIPPNPWPVVDSDRSRFVREKTIADALNDQDEQKMGKVLEKILAKAPEPASIWVKTWRSLALLMTSPFALAGVVLNAIPFYSAKYLAGKKVKKVEFYTPVRLGLNMLLYLVWMIAMLLVGLFLIGKSMWLIIWLLPLSGSITIIWWERYRQLLQLPPSGLPISRDPWLQKALAG